MSDWVQTTLGVVTNNFDGQRVPIKGLDRKPGPYPYYGASGVIDHVDGYLFDGEYLLVAEDGENLKTRNTPIAFIADGKFWVNNHAHIIRGNEKAITRFLLYAFSGLDVTPYLTGSTFPKLTQGNMNRINLMLPPLQEQRTIAHILGTLDDKIELNRRTNETLEGIARALFKSWFIDFDPVRAKAEGRQTFGMNEETAALFPDQFEESELGEIPKGWKIGAIQDYYDVLGGTTPSTKVAGYWGGSIPFATPKDLSTISSSYLISTERSITEEGLSQIGSGIISKGSFLLSSRAPIGYMAFNDVDVAINQGIIAAASKSYLSPSYIYFWSSFNMEYIKSVANGSTFLEVSKGSFKKLKMLAPPSELVEIFNSHVDQLLSAILNNEKENRILVELRDSLLPKLINGEIRVNGIEINI